MPRFAAIGLDHRHIYDLTQDLLDEGAECVGYNPDTTDPRVLAGFRKRFPHVPAAETARLLDDPSIDFVVIAARPCDRADLAIAAMQRGKDVMVDKPGITTLDQLAAVERAVRETGRIWSICLGRLASPAVQEALRIVRSGEIGRLVHTTSLGPHRLNRALRPSWFFDTPAYGGIINDIGVHSIDQFLAFAEADDAEIVSAASARSAPSRRASRTSPNSCWRPRRCAATSGSTGSRPTGCRPGAMAGSSSSAPKARWNCARTSTSRGARAPTTCSSPTGPRRATSIAASCR